MNKWMIFLGGLLSGVVLTLVFTTIINHYSMESANSESGNVETKADDGLKFFDEPGDVINENSLMVFQVLEDHMALVRGKERERSRLYLGAVYLLVNEGDKFYYDEEKIDIPEGKELRHIGMYRYTTNDGFEKNVPIVEIVDAE